MNNRRVVITGIGIISPAGNDIDTFWKSLSEGKSSIGEITKFDTDNSEVKVAAEVKNFNIRDYGFPYMLTRQLDIFTHYAMAATKMAIDDSQLDLNNTNKNRIGIFVGNCLGGVGLGERELYNLYQRGWESVSPYQSISWFYTAPQGQISIYYKLKGYSKTLVADRISSDIALGTAFQAIKMGRIDGSVVCGTEAGISPYGMALFSSSGVLSRRSDQPSKIYKPYDMNRDGMVLGEGAGTIILEELEHAKRRNAPIYGELVAFHSNCDGVHYVKNDKKGIYYEKAIRKCIEKAQMELKDIDYINLDGSALWEDDIIETNTLKQIFGENMEAVSMSCPKSMFGNTFGAAGIMDVITNCLVLKHNLVPPTVNYENADPLCDLNYTPNVAEHRDVNTTLQIARGRGGINSAIIIRDYKG